ncbi:SLOG domain-containing protein [Chitinophaga sancti]|uniref:Uncharacterized protein n=1 Tax=Chitinophaga sancti TaxID=1004 RepID=A0A1K1LLE2_9BACT|nr:hypothetical protein [Chitinophaga sancti]WQD65053.1 hypothetical protein U0033_11670 [Chitinophaga sancti]WQG89323.1 hypothetical protein SR876_30800 [Chitinophaga sancti]SFW11690.1 hypothetical protein SAMN05661012_00003 [Chitinophaga sancti]
MANTQHLSKIFLSASIPDPERNRIYYDTADIMAIRDAVRALATVIIPHSKLVWGGHPSITPLIRYVLQRLGRNVQDHVILYQSLFFEKGFIDDNKVFEHVIYTERYPTIKESIAHMRERMLSEHRFDAAVFIGGMEGIIEEYEIFKEKHPKALIIPVASTGAAARILYENLDEPFGVILKNSYAYMALFRELLLDNHNNI